MVILLALVIFLFLSVVLFVFFFFLLLGIEPGYRDLIGRHLPTFQSATVDTYLDYKEKGNTELFFFFKSRKGKRTGTNHPIRA